MYISQVLFFRTVARSKYSSLVAGARLTLLDRLVVKTNEYNLHINPYMPIALNQNLRIRNQLGMNNVNGVQ